MNITAKLGRIYKNEGMLEAVKACAAKLGKAIYRTNSARWYEYDITGEFKETATEKDLKANLCGPEETLCWIRRNGEPWMYNRREAEVAVAHEHVYPNAAINGRIVAYVKVGLNRVYINDFQKDFPLPDGYAFIYDTYVLPQYRGRGIAPYLVGFALESLGRRGFKKAGCHIPSWNTPSIAMYTRLGFKEVKAVTYFQICGLSIYTKRLPFLC